MQTDLKSELEAFCRALPGATEDVKWGDHRVFSVGEKMFAVFDVSDAEPVTLKVDPALFPILTREPGITPAPYLARASWVRLEDPRVLPRAELEALLREAHELVARKLPKRLRRELGIAVEQGFGGPNPAIRSLSELTEKATCKECLQVRNSSNGRR